MYRFTGDTNKTGPCSTVLGPLSFCRQPLISEVK